MQFYFDRFYKSECLSTILTCQRVFGCIVGGGSNCMNKDAAINGSTNIRDSIHVTWMLYQILPSS